MQRLAGALGLVVLTLWACAGRKPIYREDRTGLFPESWAQGPACYVNQECPKRSYCARVGCDGPGRCKPTPGISKDDSQPVCGCNGKVYGNDDAAHRVRVSVSHQLMHSEWSDPTCEPRFVCRDGEHLEGVVCPAPPR